MLKRWLLPLVLFLACPVAAQITKVSGKITDASNGEALSFVNVVFKGTTVGSNSDAKGAYSVEISRPNDTLVFSLVGYKPLKLPVKRYKSQTLNVKLEPSNYTFRAVEIKPSENPAHAIMRKVLANKEKNNPDNTRSLSYDVYNKIQIDLNDYPQNLKNSTWFKGAEFVFNYADTTEDGRPFIPIFLTETASKIYTTSSPERRLEVIVGSRISGIENPSVSQFLGDLFQRANIYDNYINIFGKSFVSPLNNQFLAFYRYYLVDSILVDNARHYKLLFLPKRKQDLTFTGVLLIEEQTWGVKKAEVRFNEEANVNFLKSFEAIQEFTKPDSVHWHLSNERIVADIAPLENADYMGFFARKTSKYSQIEINRLVPDSLFESNQSVIVKEDAITQPQIFWEHYRGDSLSIQEMNIFKMVDSIQTVRRLQNIKNLGKMLATGYLQWKKIDIGQYFTFFSWNPVEGYRLKFGGETSSRLSKRYQIRSNLAYGTLDNRFKFKNQFLYYVKPKSKHRNLLTLIANNDVQQLSLSPTALQLDNILTSILRRDSVLRFLTNIREFKAMYELDWFPGFSTRFGVSQRKYDALGVFSFERNTVEGIKTIDNVSTFELQFNARYSPGERVLDGSFRRSRVKSKAPVFQPALVIGKSNLTEFDLESGMYLKASLRISDRITINPIGYTNYTIEAGRYWGRAPYLFLEIHQGSQTYTFDRLSFNMMQVFEFCSDQYAYLFFDHHFDGFFLNKVPLLRKLKWREVVSLRSVMGTMSAQNRELLNYPGGFDPRIGRIPYMEAGFAVENIFKFIRVDALWRVSHQKEGVNLFGLRISFQFNL